MEKYTASNGIIITRELSGFTYTDPDPVEGYKDGLYENAVEALREFFRAEEDERLGRWRWPENPDYVVYPGKAVAGVRVSRELTGATTWVYRSEGGKYATDESRAASAYFDAHPEPKPWHYAKTGEVWALKFGVSDEEEIVQARDEFFVNIGTEPRWFDTTGKRAPEIAAGRRIWPEKS